MKLFFTTFLVIILCRVSSAQTAFTCDGYGYQTVGNPAHLHRFNFSNNTFVDLGVIGSGFELRATGYNKADNFAYAIRNSTKELIKFGADRVAVTTTLTGTYANDLVGVNTVAGDFGPDGYFYIMTGGSTNIVYMVDVVNNTVNQRFLTSESFDKGDIVWSASDAKFYTVGSPASSAGPQYLYNFPAGANGATVTVSKISTSVPGGTSLTYIGALFVDSQHRIFGYFNNNGKVYNFSKTTGTATEIAATGVVTSMNDGFACAPISHTLLPLVLTSFSVQPATQGYQLQWETSSEQNTSHFEIEYTVNGNNFTYLDQVASANNSNHTIQYSYHAQTISSHQKVMFRLKMIDSDGSFTYSKIVIAGGMPTTNNLKIYPSIAAPGEPVYVFMTSGEEMAVYHAGSGRLMKKITYKNNNQAYSLATNGWPAGMYIVRTKDAVVKFILQ